MRMFSGKVAINCFLNEYASGGSGISHVRLTMAS